MVLNEIVEFNFFSSVMVYYLLEESFYLYNECSYFYQVIGEIKQIDLVSMFILVDVGFVKVLIIEMVLCDYVGLWLLGNGKDGLKGIFLQ